MATLVHLVDRREALYSLDFNCFCKTVFDSHIIPLAKSDKV